jgi:glucan-binding YG repeat protein
MRRVKWVYGVAILLCFLVISVFANKESVAEAKSGKWMKDSKGYWYSYSDGTYAKKEWIKSGGKWYYLNEKGYMQTGWKKIGSKWYWFAKNGAMQTGWKKISGKWYWFAKNGAMQTGWKKLSGKWYWFMNSGVMQTGWKKLSNKWYCFADSGAMQTGWKTIGWNKYYFSSDGVMATGNVTINGTVYRFSKNGVLLQDGLEKLVGEEWINLKGYYSSRKRFQISILSDGTATIVEEEHGETKNGECKFIMDQTSYDDQILLMQEENSTNYYYVWSEVAKALVCEDNENPEKKNGLKESCEKKYAKYFPGYRFGGFVYIENGISYGVFGIACSATKLNEEVTRTEKGEWVNSAGHHIKLNGDGTGFAYSSSYSKGYIKLVYEYVDSERFTLSYKEGGAYEHGIGTYYSIDGNMMVTDKGVVWYYMD